MNINFDDLKKEFDAFKNSCESENCEQEENEEEGGFIEIVQKYMLAPANCGVYFSRLDIKVIGLEFGENVQVRERKRMIRDILKAVTSKEELERVFEIINKNIDQKLEIYNKLIENFPSTKELFEDKFKKAQQFKRKLNDILEEIEEEEI